MKINLDYLETIYNNLQKEKKEEQDITCYEDFISYVVGLIIYNLQYDFNINVEYDDLFIEE